MLLAGANGQQGMGNVGNAMGIGGVGRVGRVGGTAAPVARPFGPFRGQLQAPVPGEVTVAFGSEQTCEFGTSIARAGIELAAMPGESVYAIHG